MLSLIIPCFNEQENLKKLLKKLNSLLGTYSNEKIELVLVDNGSTDSSREIIKKSDLYLNNKINLVKIDNNIGYGNGVYNGIKSSKGDFIAWFHADLQTNPSDVINIFELSKKKLLEIIELSEKTLKLDNFEIEVKYQSDTIGKFGLDFNGTSFLLTNKNNINFVMRI